MENKISVVINTYNSENLVRECFESVKLFDEIVVCDMYSEDGTLAVAKEYNAKIVMHEKCGFVEPARNFAIQSASNDWVLLIDTDERVTLELVKFLKDFVLNPQGCVTVKIPRRNNYWGKFIEMEYPNALIRFFRKDSVDWPSKIHAVPEINGAVYEIPPVQKELALIHYTSDNIRSFIDIVNKYTDYEVEKLVLKNKKINLGYAFFQGIWLTIEKFILKKGYKDGAHGFILCAIRGFYKFLVYAKYWEYKKNRDRG